MDGEDPAKLGPKARWVVALVFIVPGCIFGLATFDIGPLNRSDINGPPWIGVVTGGIFGLGGLALALAGSPRFGQLAPYVGILLVGGFASLANWVAFGEWSGGCSGGLSAFGISLGGLRPDLECRIAFGIGALMLDSLLVWGLGAALSKSFGARAPFTWLERAGKGLFFLSVLPFILLLAAWALGSGLLASAREWRRTGRWPVNEEFRNRMRLKKTGRAP